MFVAGLLSFGGCYTQLATTHEDDINGARGEQYSADDTTHESNPDSDSYERGFEEGYQRSPKWRVGLSYYYPAWYSHWSYDPWYDGYNSYYGWTCGTPYIAYYPHVYYPWYGYSSYYYGSSGYAWRSHYFPSNSSRGNIYATRNSGSRRTSGTERRDGGIYRGTTGSGYSLPTAVTSSGSRTSSTVRSGSDVSSRRRSVDVSRGSSNSSRESGGWIYRAPATSSGSSRGSSSPGVNSGGRISSGRGSSSSGSSGGSRNSGGSRSRYDGGSTSSTSAPPSYSPPPAPSYSPPPASSSGGSSGGENRNSGGRRR